MDIFRKFKKNNMKNAEMLQIQPSNSTNIPLLICCILFEYNYKKINANDRIYVLRILCFIFGCFCYHHK